MSLHHTDKIALLAPGKWGKTTLASRLMPGFPRAIILDCVHSFPRIEETDLIAESIAELGELAKLCILHRAETFRIFRRYPNGFHGSYADDLDAVIRIAYELGNVLLVVDEFQEYMNREQISPTLKSLLLRGRHRGVGIMGITQRPAEISKTFLAQADHFFLGGFSTPSELAYLRGFFG